MKFKTKSFDLLIIGAGGAGLRAAIEAAKQKNLRIAIICKSLLGKAHTVMAEGGMAAALQNVDSADSWQMHFRDTLKGGKLLNQWKMAENLAKEAPERVLELERFGAIFDRTDKGKINQRPFGGHSYARLAHIGDRTGLEMIRTLQDYTIHLGAEVFMEYTVVKIFTNKNEVTGLLAFDRNTGEFTVFNAPSIIIATGGCGRCFAVQTNSWETTGDGHALAYEAGAELIDMEFMQFHPTGMVWPVSVKGILVTEGVRGEGGILKNSLGERFMFKYIPENFKNDVADTEEEANRWVKGDRKNNRKPPELLTRDVVAKAILAEVAAGRGSTHGGVYLDISSQRSAEYIKRKLPSMYHQFKELGGLDITKEPMEVGPSAHYIMGGIRVNFDTCESTVKGLFAAGEVAGGLHGANRLGGNSLSDLLVFGARAGKYAAEHAKKIKIKKTEKQEIEKAVKKLISCMSAKPEKGENPYFLQNELKEKMDKYCGIIRNKEDLKKGLKEIEKLKQREENVKVAKGKILNTAWHSSLDLKSLLVVAEALALAALERKESRGAHTRSDFPEYSSKFGKQNIIIYKDGDKMKTKKLPLPKLPEELKKILEVNL